MIADHRQDRDARTDHSQDQAAATPPATAVTAVGRDPGGRGGDLGRRHVGGRRLSGAAGDPWLGRDRGLGRDRRLGGDHGRRRFGREG